MACWKHVLGAFTVSLAAMGQASSDEGAWRVGEADYECIIRHVDEYSKSQHEPVIIVVPACPEVDPQLALASVAKNTILPELKPSSGGADGPATAPRDAIITLPRQAVACLATLAPQRVSGAVLIPKDIRC